MDDFEQWMRQQFPEDTPAPAEEETLTGELMELLERHHLPHQAILLIFARVMPVYRAMGRIDHLANRLEADGMTRPGFRHELMTLITRGLQRDVDAT
jgi:hypothetical protein